MYVNNDIKYKQADLDYGQQLEKLFGITPKNCTFQVTENQKEKHHTYWTKMVNIQKEQLQNLQEENLFYKLI